LITQTGVVKWDKYKMRIVLFILLLPWILTCSMYTWAATRSDVTGQNFDDLAAEDAVNVAIMRQQGEQIYALQQQQQALINAQRQANLVAAEIAKWNASVAVITNKTSVALQKLSLQCDPQINDLISNQSKLEQVLTNLEVQDGIENERNNHNRAKQMFQPKDPWRKLNGTVCNAKDINWLQFTGKIIEIRPNGILLHGKFGQPVEESAWYECDYYVDNFPNQKYPLADDEEITTSYNCVAHLDEGSQSTYVYTNTTIDMRVHTVRRLDYGKIVDSPPQELANKWTYRLTYSSTGASTFTKNIVETGKQISAIKAKLAQLQSEYADKSKVINAECDTEIKDLPNVFAKV